MPLRFRRRSGIDCRPSVAEIVLDRVSKAFARRRRRRRRRLARDRERRVPRARRPVGLRQVHAPADDRRARGRHRRRDPDRRPRRDRAAAARARHRDGLPELRALPAHDACARTSATASRCGRRRRPRSRSASTQVAELLGLEQLLDRRPAALSGGQRQRVAMGRAIVREPKAFLMDEPLSNLDAKLRVSMRAQLAALHARLGDDDDLRHARPGRGDDARPPRRGDARRADPAGRHAAGALRRAREPLRRRVHRLAGDEPRRGRRRATARSRSAATGSRSPAAPSRAGPRDRRHPARGVRGRGVRRPVAAADRRRGRRSSRISAPTRT